MKYKPFVSAIIMSGALALGACEQEPMEQMGEAREKYLEAEGDLAKAQAEAQERIDKARREAAELRMDAEKRLLEARRAAEQSTAKAERDLQQAREEIEKARKEIAQQKAERVKEMNEDLRRLDKRLSDLERRSAKDTPEERARLGQFMTHARNLIQQARLRIMEFDASEPVNWPTERGLATMQINHAEDAVDQAEDYKDMNVPAPLNIEPGQSGHDAVTSPTLSNQAEPGPSAQP